MEDETEGASSFEGISFGGCAYKREVCYIEPHRTLNLEDEFKGTVMVKWKGIG